MQPSEMTWSVPQPNLATFQYLFAIEVCLRELIIDKLTQVAGPHWYDQRVPTPQLEKYKLAMDYNRKIPWRQYIPHHLVYYLDFPVLRQLIEQENNWRDAFQIIFLRKDQVSANLSELEPIRNNIAHNRKVSTDDLTLVAGVYRRLEIAIGQPYFSELANRCSTAPDLPLQLNALFNEVKVTSSQCRKGEPIISLPVWTTVSSSWWFDDVYLEHDLTSIITYYRLVTAYGDLPRHRGSGHELLTWVRQHNLEETSQVAIQHLNSILSMRP